jgi:fatty-acyl-CoA synthase
MTEMSPLGTVGALKPPFAKLTGEQKIDVLQLQGYPPFGVQMKITDDDGKELPWDGKTFGQLKVAGPAVSKAYYRVDKTILDDEGFFDTGDVATVDEHGYMRITDRSKDVIKSGGEWISSIDLENVVVAHPAVAEAAVIGVHHPKWDERPLLIVQLEQGKTATREDILKFMEGKIGKWWMPDDVVQVVERSPIHFRRLADIGCHEIFLDLSVHTSCTRWLLTN